jgi:hypothetical protein
MSILYVADPGHEDAIRRIGLGTKLLYLVGCWLGDRCTQRGVSDGDATRSAATKGCAGPTNPAASQHVGVGWVTDCDDPNGKRHRVLTSLPSIIADPRSYTHGRRAGGDPRRQSVATVRHMCCPTLRRPREVAVREHVATGPEAM